MEKQYMLTESGLRKLEEELDYLKSEKRKDVSEKIKVALSFGDLSENSEYDEAKNEQAMVESRINELERMLQNVKIINEDDLSKGVVHIGSKIVVKDIEMDEEVTYKIVGTQEANPMMDLISDESPVGKAFLGHKEGDMIDIDTPSGTFSYQILQILK